MRSALLAGYAIFSGYKVATVLGAISAKIKMISVNTKGAMTVISSPPKCMASMVVILEAMILDKVLPMSMADKILSGFGAKIAE